MTSLIYSYYRLKLKIKTNERVHFIINNNSTNNDSSMQIYKDEIEKIHLKYQMY